MKNEISPDKVVITSILVDVLDIIVNLAISLITGSAVMIAEAFEGISDFSSKMLVYLGLRSSKRKYDEQHPFGHGKTVYFGVMLAGIMMLFLTSVMTIILGVNKIINPKPISSLWLAYIALSFFTLTNGYALSLSIKRLKGEKGFKTIRESLSGTSMVETETTLILDLASTSATITGLISMIIYTITGNIFFDGLGAIIIGAILALLTVLLILNARDLLIGRKASNSTEHRIREAALSVKNVTQVISLKTMNMGINQLLVNIEVHVSHRLKTKQIENITKEVKAKIIKENPEVTHVNVEIGKNKPIEHKIREAALSVKNVKQVVNLKTIEIGINQLLVNIEVHVSQGLKKKQIENLIKNVKDKIIKENPEVTNVNVKILLTKH